MLKKLRGREKDNKNEKNISMCLASLYSNIFLSLAQRIFYFPYKRITIKKFSPTSRIISYASNFTKHKKQIS